MLIYGSCEPVSETKMNKDEKTIKLVFFVSALSILNIK